MPIKVKRFALSVIYATTIVALLPIGTDACSESDLSDCMVKTEIHRSCFTFDPSYAELRSRALLAAGHAEESIPILQKLLSCYPHPPSGVIDASRGDLVFSELCGQAYEQLGDFEKALKYYDDGDVVWAGKRSFAILMKQGRIAEAMAIADRAVKEARPYPAETREWLELQAKAASELRSKSPMQSGNKAFAESSHKTSMGNPHSQIYAASQPDAQNGIKGQPVQRDPVLERYSGKKTEKPPVAQNDLPAAILQASQEISAAHEKTLKGEAVKYSSEDLRAQIIDWCHRMEARDYIRRAQLYVQQRAMDAALADAASAVQIGGLELLPDRVTVMLQAGKADSAIHELEDGIASSQYGRERSMLRLLLAKLCFESNQFSKAISAADLCIQDEEHRGPFPRESEPLYMKIFSTEIEPMSAPAHVIKAKSEAATGKFVEAHRDAKLAADQFFDIARIGCRDKIREWMKTLPE
jgi:tetratricopeptide (TPR) repeat protein